MPPTPIADALLGSPWTGRALIAAAVMLLLVRDRLAPSRLRFDLRRDLRALLLLGAFVAALLAMALVVGELRGV